MALKRMLFASLLLVCFMFKPTSQLEMNNWLLNKNHAASFETEGPRVTLQQEPHRGECYNAMYLGMIASSSNNYWEFTCTGACKVKIGISRRTDFGDYDEIKGFFFNGTDVEDYVNRAPKLPAKNGKPIRSNDRIGFILNLEKSKFFISHNERPVGTLRLPEGVYNSYRQKIHPTIIFCSSGTVEVREVQPISDIIGR